MFVCVYVFRYCLYRPWADYRSCSLKGEISGLWFSYTLWCVALRKKWLQNYVGALRSYGPLKYVTTSNSAMFVYLTLKHPCT